MAVFSRYFNENDDVQDSGLMDADFDSMLYDEDIEAAHEDSYIEVAARLVAETTINYNRIMEACAIAELNFLEENGREMIYEADLSGFFEKAKEFFRSIWEKIQSMFKKAAVQFNSWFTSDKDFIKKYKKDLNAAVNTKGSFGDKEMDVYPYVYLTKGESAITATAVAGNKAEDKVSTVDEIKADLNKSAEDLKSMIEKDYSNDKMQEYVEELRAELVAGVASACGVSYNSTSLTSAEFSKELTEVLQGGESSKVSKSLSSLIADAMSFLEGSDKIKKGINDAMKEVKKGIDKDIKDIEALQKEYKSLLNKDTNEEGKKAGHGHTLCSKAISLLKDSKVIVTTAQGIMLNTLKACSRQSKAICVKALGYKAPKNESAALEEGAVGGFLNRINLV